jgi:hypothetical protein
MIKRISMPVALALCAGIGATGAQAAAGARPCLTHDEAAGVMLVLAPEAIRGVGIACSQTLPSSALLRQTSGPFLDRIEVESNRAWPQARSTIARLSGQENLAALLDSETMKPMLAALLAPLIINEVKPKDCAAIDHIITQLAPLPPRNVAEIVVTVLELESADKASKGEKSAFPLCPVPRS